MSGRILKEEHVRSLSKGAGGASYSVILPKHLVIELGWKEKQKLKVSRQGNSIVITDRKGDI